MLQPESKNDPGMRSGSCFEAADGTRKPLKDVERILASLYVFVPENALTFNSWCDTLLAKGEVSRREVLH